MENAQRHMPDGFGRKAAFVALTLIGLIGGQSWNA